MKNWELVQKKISEMNEEEFFKTLCLNSLTINFIGTVLDNLNIRCRNHKCGENKSCRECVKEFLNSKYQEPKQEKWIVHRKLRTNGIEVYVVERRFGDYTINVSKEMSYFTSHIKEKAVKLNDLHSAIFMRDKLNEIRKGKQYLWVISKVEE